MKVIKRKPRCLKLKYRKLEHMFGLLDKNMWANYPLAPPTNKLLVLNK